MLLFDRFSNAVYLILIPTGVIICAIGLLTAGFFRSLEKEQLISGAGCGKIEKNPESD